MNLPSIIFQKIKNINHKKILLFAVLILIITPLISDAFIGTGIFDFFTSMLAGISEMVHPFAAFFTLILMTLILSGMSLHVAAMLLKIAMDPSKLSVLESSVVQVGWQFTSSLANTAIIVALVVIGLATILGKENYGAKKTLPKLIIVALLINFSLVFVAAIVDIFQIIMNTFAVGNLDVVSGITDAILESWETNVLIMTGYLGGLMTSFMIPFISGIAQFTFVTVSTTILLPTIIQSIMQALTSFIIAGILFIYAFLFYARIFIIQILAILSPLAFVSWILPKTKKLWDQWIQALIEWCSLGVVLFFFLLLSTVAVEPLRPEQGFASTTFSGFSSIPTIYIYYITLAIFLVTTAYLSKKFMPEGAKAIIDGAKSTLMTAKKATAPIGSDIKRRIGYNSAKRATADTIQEKEKQLENRKQEFKESSGLKKISTGANYLKTGASKISSHARRGAYHYTGQNPDGIVSKEEKRQAEQRLAGRSDEEKERILDRTKKEEESNEKAGKIMTGAKKLGINSSKTNASEEVKTKIIEEFAEKGKFDKIPDGLLAEKWDKLGKDIKKEILKKRPETHIDLADSMEEGMENMIKEIESMKPSDTKDINLDKIKKAYRTTVASVIARDGSAVKSWGESSKHKKQTLIDSLDGASESTMKQFDEHVGKNVDKWSGLYETIEEKEEKKEKRRKKK